MQIQVLDFGNILIDGRPAGSIVDVIANYPAAKAGILAACQQRDNALADAVAALTRERDEATTTLDQLRGLLQEQEDQHRQALAQRDEAAVAMVRRHERELHDQRALHQRTVDQLQQRIAALEQQVQVVMSLPQAEAAVRAKKIADAERRKQEAEQELSALRGTVTAAAAKR